MKLWLINNETILECGAMKRNLSNKCRNCFPFVAIEIENSDELGWHFIIVLAAKVIQLLFIFSDFQSPPTKNIKAKVKFQADRICKYFLSNFDSYRILRSHNLGWGLYKRAEERNLNGRLDIEEELLMFKEGLRENGRYL